MQAVGIRVGQNTNLVIAQASKIGAGGIHTNGQRDVVYFLGGQYLTGVDLPRVQNFSAQGHDGLKFSVSSLLGGAASRVTFHQKQFRSGGILAGAVRQFARQRGARRDSLARHFFCRVQTTLRVANGHFGDFFAFTGMGVEPQTERILGNARDEDRRLSRGQPLLGLSRKLRV